MRKLFIALCSIGAALVVPAAATAAPPYPVNDLVVVAPTTVLTPGGTFTATVNNCIPGETVAFVVVETGANATAICGADGSASASLPTPDSSGTYTVQGTGLTSRQRDTTTIQVGSVPTLPRTGGDSSSALQIALMVTLAGALLVGVTLIRRRSVRSA